MKPTYLPEITGEDAVRFLREDAEPLSKTQKEYVEECSKKYDKYFNREK
jgi:hypothetical protein